MITAVFAIQIIFIQLLAFKINRYSLYKDVILILYAIFEYVIYYVVMFLVSIKTDVFIDDIFVYVMCAICLGVLFVALLSVSFIPPRNSKIEPHNEEYCTAYLGHFAFMYLILYDNMSYLSVIISALNFYVIGVSYVRLSVPVDD